MTKETVAEAALSTWSIDPTHSSIQFKIRHMAIAWVRGTFRLQGGTLQWSPENLAESRVTVDIDASSVSSGDDQRDDHLRKEDFLDVERFPTIHFQSGRITSREDNLTVDGDLTIHGVTRPAIVHVSELSSATADPWGGTRIAISASAKINRKDYGLTWNTALETGGFLVGDEIFFELDLEFVMQAQ